MYKTQSYVVFLDVRLEEYSGLKLAERLQQIDSKIHMILVTGDVSVKTESLKKVELHLLSTNHLILKISLMIQKNDFQTCKSFFYLLFVR